MNEYPKIQTIWKRTDRGLIIPGDYATPELTYLAKNEWEWTEKVDGTNIRVGWNGDGVKFGGRTANAQLPAKLVEALLEMFTPERFTAAFDGPCVLYGEGYGAGIQKGGGNYSATQTFVLFDVTVGDWWLRRADVVDVAVKLGLRIVPSVGMGNLQWAYDLVGDGITSIWGDFAAEGVVGRPRIELFNRKGERIMAKMKARDIERIS